MTAAAAVPRAVDPRVQAEVARDDVLADAASRRGWQQATVGIAQRLAVRSDRTAARVDRPAEVVDPEAVGRS